MSDKKTIKALFLAAKKGNVKKLAELLVQFDTPDVLDEDGEMTLLSWAAYYGSVKSIAYLIEQGANIDGSGDVADVPISHAAINEHAKAFEMLLDAGANLAIEHYTSLYLFEFSIKQKRLDWLKILFNHDFLRKKHGDDGDLLKLVYDEEILTYLLSLGFDIHKAYDDEYSAFANAARMDDVSQFKLFMRHVNMQQVKGVDGYTALAESTVYDDSQITHMLIESGVAIEPPHTLEYPQYHETPMMNVCESGQLELLKKLIEHGGDIHNENYGGSPLISAADGKSVEIVKFLLSEGAKITSKQDRAEQSFMDYACRSLDLLKLSLDEKVSFSPEQIQNAWMKVAETDHVDLAQKLYDEKANIYATVPKDEFTWDEADRDSIVGYNALLFAALYANKNMLEWLLTFEWDMNHRSFNGDTVLFCLADDDSLLTYIDLVIQKGAEVSHKTEYGWTPLMYALRNGAVGNAQLLMQHGADIHAKSDDGYSVLMSAVRGKCEAMISTLLKEHVNVNDKWQGATALDIAKAQNSHNIVTLLEKAGGVATGSIPDELEDALWEEENGEENDEIPEGYLPELVRQLKACIPDLDTEGMLESISNYFEADGYDDVETRYIVLEWLSDGLIEQNHMVYEEWKQYFGELPDLKMFEQLDIDEYYDPEPIVNTIEQTHMWAHEIPYLEYMNHFIKPHGLTMVSFAFENLYMMCVKDDKQELTKLDALLEKVGITTIWHDEMTLDACLNAMRDAE